MNVSYKIIAKALSLKIQHLLPQIICREKTRFIKSWYILDNIIAVWEGMEWARHSHQQAMFLKIDFAKAYDRIEWPFILAMLHALGLVLSFCNWFRCCLVMPLLASPSMVDNLKLLGSFIPSARVILLCLICMSLSLKDLGIYLLMPFPWVTFVVFPFRTPPNNL